ncbi:carbohydrate ABC transporter permease [Microbacterium sp. UCD-TDU]|uniref:carbohydrate ABC transporter permease n=1 Tax=Microbacterium sp. UCD-TDU TaxID=1247714 RepID=UPI00034CB5DA|nr:carbohydrate ABC transporter permease [Microbacterium sp. UCD-TDU]EYT57699.1 sugar ABC transporter permease [Microbacterium sp. UCD-TDU]
MTTTIITKRSWAHSLGTGGKFVILGLAAFLTLGPVVWTLVTALSPTDSVTQEVAVGFGAFADVFTKIPLWLYAWNSALVVMLVAAGQMLSAAMAGYVFAKFEFRSKKILFALILATMMVPLQVTIVPVFMLVRGMGLADTLLALIVPALPTAFGTFLMRQYFMGIPTELGEAAQLDGAGPWRTFFGVYLPLATPALAIVGILAFNHHWNEFFRPLIMTISDQNFTLPLGLVTLQGNLGTGSISTVLAGVILSMIPALLVFFFGQKPLREGLTAGVGK